MRPEEITQEIRRRADEAVAESLALVDMRFAHTVNPLAEALHVAADLLDAQQKSLIELRNGKADA